MIEEKITPKQKNLIEAMKQHKYLEANDPDDETLKLLKQQISNNISEEDKD